MRVLVHDSISELSNCYFYIPMKIAAIVKYYLTSVAIIFVFIFRSMFLRSMDLPIGRDQTMK